MSENFAIHFMLIMAMRSIIRAKKLPAPLLWTEKVLIFPFLFSAQFSRLDFVRHLLAVIGAMI